MSYVFVSHASPDKPRVKPIVDALLAAGFKIWIDNPAAAGFAAHEIDQFHRIRAGGRWEDEIDEAKKQAGCILVCWSNQAVASEVLSGNERITWLEEAGFARVEKKLVACTIDDVDPKALPGTHAAQQLPCLDSAMPKERWDAVMRTLVSDIQRKMEERPDETEAAVAFYVDGLRRFCAKSTYTLSDSLSSDAEKLFVDIEGGTTTIAALSAQAQGHTSGKPVVAMFARQLLAEAINRNAAVVLCGGAGTGKSTLLRRFALLAWDQPEKIGLATRHLTILVRLRHLAAARGTSFEEKIRQALKDADDFTPGEMPDDFLKSWPAASKVPLLFLFDALDEAPSGDRARLLTALEQLRAKFPNMPLVLSTRDSSLVRNTVFAAADKTTCIAVQQLAPATARSIAQALLTEAELQRFLQERERGRSFAWDTALGVRMASAVFKRNGKLPETRGELYEQLIRESFGDQGEGSGQTPEILKNTEGAFHILGAIAAMNLDPAIASAPNLETCVAEAIQDLRQDIPGTLARGEVTGVLDWLRRRGGVLTSLEPLAWSHETYREFLAAHWIARRFKPDEPIVLDLLKRAGEEPRLHTVMLFAYAIWAGSPQHRQEDARSALAEQVCASFRTPVPPPPKKSFLSVLGIGGKAPTQDSNRLDTGAPMTLFLAEILAEIRPGSTPAIAAVIDRLSSLHRDFIGYFDDPKNRCEGDENVVLCLRRWADHPPLKQALQPLADRYMKLLHQFDLPNSGIVHFLLLAGRKPDIEPPIMNDRQWTNFDLLECIRGAVAAEGPNGPTALPLARAVFNGSHPALKPVRLGSGVRFTLGPSDFLRDQKSWIAPVDLRDEVGSEYYRSAISAAAGTLYDAGFAEEVMTRIAGDDFPVDLFSVCIGRRKSDALVQRCAHSAELSPPKRAFAILLLFMRSALGDLGPDQVLPILASVERDPTHTRWAAALKYDYCAKLERFEEMQVSCDLLTKAEPSNAKAWFNLGRSALLLRQFGQALPSLERAATLGHAAAEVHYFRGRVLQGLARYWEAVTAFDAAAAAGNDQLRMWEARLDAKYLASWYASLEADVEYLCAQGFQDRPFVRHWRGVTHCLAGRHDEAIDFIARSDAALFRPGQMAFFLTIAMVSSGHYEHAGLIIDQRLHGGDAWTLVVCAMLGIAKKEVSPSEIAGIRDRLLSGETAADGLEPAFWLSALMDDREGAARCVERIVAQKDARVLHVMKADLILMSAAAKPWCAAVLETALAKLDYPKPPLLTGEIILRRRIESNKTEADWTDELDALLAEANTSLERVFADYRLQMILLKTRLGERKFARFEDLLSVFVSGEEDADLAGSGPIRKKLHPRGMRCTKRSIATLHDEHALARDLMAVYGKAKRAIVMIRLGKTAHFFCLCNFKESELGLFDLKMSGPLDLYLSFNGRCLLRETLFDPFEVTQVICNDHEFMARMKQGVQTRIPIDYIFVDRDPDFGGREVIYDYGMA